MSKKYEKLTPKMKKLIEVLSIPDNEMLNVTEICKLAGIAMKTYYEYFQDERFIKAYDRLTQDLLRNAVVPLVKASIREGKKGSYQDRKMVFEMTGAYQAKSSVDLNVKGFEDLLQGLAADALEED